MKKLSDRFQYYSGILCATGMNVDINDLVHISALLEAEEQGLLRKVEQGEWIKQTRCIDTWSCTNCGEVEKVPTCMGEPIYNFCPNCGAKMKVVE